MGATTEIAILGFPDVHPERIESASNRFQIDDGTIDIWSFSLGCLPQRANSWRHVLDADERERADRYVHEKHRTEFFLAHGVVRWLLSRYTGVAPGQLEFGSGVAGNVLMFAHFAKLLGTERPFYGLEARGLDDSERPFKSIARMAAHYIAETRSVQPKGPYTLVGSCTGGVVAYEMTRQLRTQGDKVVLLLLESWHPSSAQAPRFTGGFLRPAAFLASKAAEYGRILANTPMAQWPQLVASKLRAARHTVLAESTKEQGMTSYQIDRVTNATWRAVSRYKPQALPGGLLHIIASRRWLAPTTIDTRRMWVELAGADGHAVFLEAEDSGQLFTEPHVDNLARVVRTYIESQLE